MASGIRSVVELTRPGNTLLAAAGAVIGGLGMGAPEAVTLVLVGLAGALGVAAGNAYNDAVDHEVDRRAHPERPVPRGDVSPRSASGWAWTFFGAALAISFWLGLATGFLALAFIAGLVAYDRRLKFRGWTGHVVVSLIVAGVFLFGAVAAGGIGYVPGMDDWAVLFARTEFRLVLAMASVAFLANLGRELYKAVQDADADASHRVTAAHQWGLAAARRLGAASLVLSVVLGVAWILSGVFALPAGAGLVPAFASFLVAPFAKAPATAALAAKVGMGLALLGFLAMVLI